MAFGMGKEARLTLKLVDSVTAPATKVAAAMGRMKIQMDKFEAASLRVRQDFLRVTTGAAVLGAGFAAPFRQAMKMEGALADVAKVSDFNADQLMGLDTGARALARSLPLSADQILRIAAEVAKTGAEFADILPRAELIAKAATAWGMSADQAGEKMAKLAAGLGLSQAQVESLADTMNYLGNNTAATEADLVDFTLRAGPIARAAGLQAKSLTALGASLISSGAGADIAATAVQAMIRGLAKGEAATGPQVEALKALGLEAKAVAAALNDDADGTILDVFERLRDLEPDRQYSVANQLFGDEGRFLLTILNDLDSLRELMESANDTAKTGGSVQKEFAERVKTTEMRLRLLKNQVGNVASVLGNVFLSEISAGSDGLKNMLEQMEKWTEANGAFIKRLGLVTAGLVGARVAASGLRFAFYAALRPMNLLIGAAGFLAYRNFDQLSAAAEKLTKTLSGLRESAFVKGFLKGAGDAADGMASALERAVKGIDDLLQKGGALKEWLDSNAGEGWGESLGKLTVYLAGIGATAAGIGLVAGPLRAIGKAVLFLSGIKPAWALLKFISRIGATAAGIGLVAKPLRAIGNAVLFLSGIKPAWALLKFIRGIGKSGSGISQTASAMDAVAQSARKVNGLNGMKVPSIVGGLVGTGLAASLIPSDETEAEVMINRGRERSDRWNKWLGDNIGSPKSWIEDLLPLKPGPVQGPLTLKDTEILTRDEREVSQRFDPMKGFNVLGDFERRVAGKKQEPNPIASGTTFSGAVDESPGLDPKRENMDQGLFATLDRLSENLFVDKLGPALKDFTLGSMSGFRSPLREPESGKVLTREEREILTREEREILTREEREVSQRFDPMKGFNVLGDYERRVEGKKQEPSPIASGMAFSGAGKSSGGDEIKNMTNTVTVTLNAPISVTTTDANVGSEVAKALDGQLRRAAETTFSGVKQYGDM